MFILGKHLVTPDLDISFAFLAISLSIMIWLLYHSYQSRLRLSSINPSLAWNHALEVLDEPIILTDNNDNLVHANKAFYKHIKQSKYEVLGKKVHKLLHKNDDYLICEACQKRMAKVDATITREADDISNPLPIPVDIIIKTIKNEKGEIIGSLQSFHDISHLRRAEKALRQSQQKLAEAQRIGRMGNWEWNISDDTFDWSEEMWRIFGSPNIQQTKSGYQNFMAFIFSEDRHKVHDSIQSAIKNRNHCFLIDHRITLPDGELRDIRHQGKLSYTDDDNCVRLAGVTQDITTQKAIEHALHEAKEKAQVTLQSIGDAVLTMDVNGIIDYANPVAEELLMTPLDDMTGKHHKDILNLIDETTLKPIADPVRRSLVGKSEFFHEQLILLRPDQSQFSISITSAPIIIKNKVVTGVTLVIHDVTIMRSLARQLTYQASHDELTGLVNRREFETRLNHAVKSANKYNKQHALIYMDLDQFKIVNDTCGHIAGDELLKQISNVLSSKIRDIDTLARLGGDEFAVLLRACPASVSHQIAESLRAAIEDFRFAWEDQMFRIGVSIGLIPITADSGNQTDILRKADTACYVAKDNGRNRVYVYDNESHSIDMHQGEMQWAQRINQALESDNFELFSQTIKPIKSSTNAHFEILLRMKDSNGKYIQPDAFIPAAERYQLMVSIDRWVIANTLKALKNIPTDMQWSSYVCSINLSGQSLTDTSLLEFIIQNIDDNNINPENICFEITETAAIANLTSAGRFINVLRDMGIRFSLDDFGSGLSSFDYLKNLNIDYLKIDGSFVKDINRDRVDFAMVKSINQIGHLMGVETIAEFVESTEIMQVLKKLNVDYGQGFYIASPLPLSQFLRLNQQQKTG